MRASNSSCERGICHVVVTVLDSTGIDTCTGSVTGLVLDKFQGVVSAAASTGPTEAVASSSDKTHLNLQAVATAEANVTEGRKCSSIVHSSDTSSVRAYINSIMKTGSRPGGKPLPEAVLYLFGEA